ncbi:unnamed protein product [Parnassius apollo]|uniref:(apollo) hypothetical protein n=1 Tax=Parnassius apollo TaxID=110799 RepID=A0A8S3WKF2_PARAO|nr:unnamed protein product [Parnassius apollo]
MAGLRDDQIEEQLKQLFGLENPEESEDNYEEDDFSRNSYLQQLLETSVNNESEHSVTPSNTINSPASETQAVDNAEPSCSDVSPTEFTSLSLQSTVTNCSSEDDDDTSITRRHHRSGVRISSTSESDSESNQDEEEWKKVMWSTERPNSERFSDILLKPSVFFPSRTSPLAYFSRFFSDDILELIMEQTNLYATQQRTKHWEPVTVMDIRMVLGIIIMMGLHNVPTWDLYWSTDPFFRVDEIASVMTCKKFKKIMENLHLADNSIMPSRNDPQYDKLYKVRPLLDMMNNACEREARSTTSQSIDEAMIKFKGTSSLKQYMPLKPIKRGFKVWVRADSATGYVYQFEIYTGKSSDNSPELGLGANVVKKINHPSN